MIDDALTSAGDTADLVVAPAADTHADAPSESVSTPAAKKPRTRRSPAKRKVEAVDETAGAVVEQVAEQTVSDSSVSAPEQEEKSAKPAPTRRRRSTRSKEKEEKAAESSVAVEVETEVSGPREDGPVSEAEAKPVEVPATPSFSEGTMAETATNDAAPKARSAKAKGKVKETSRAKSESKSKSKGDADIEELKALVNTPLRGRPSAKKKEAVKIIEAALVDPSPESVQRALEAASVLKGRSKANAKPDVAEQPAPASDIVTVASSDTEAAAVEDKAEAGSAESNSVGDQSVAENPTQAESVAAEPTEGYGPRRRHHDRRGDGKQGRQREQREGEKPRDGKKGQDRQEKQERPEKFDRPERPDRQDRQEKFDRPDRPRDGKDRAKKFDKNDRRDRNSKRDFATGPSLTREELLAMEVEELQAKATELELEVDGLNAVELAETIYQTLFKREGFFDFTGILELMNDGTGIVRTKGYLPSDADLFVPAAMVRNAALRRGDKIVGVAHIVRSGEKRPGVCKIAQINGRTVDEIRNRPRFGDLTPVFPSEPLRMEHGKDSVLGRVIDLVAPVGKGQRGLIVSPPKAGKTTVLKKIAESIAANNPEVHLICLLVDERPEEVTDMQRSIRGEVVASTFDMPCENHITVSELVIERAKRLVEQGEDVVILLDSITRLARAYNLAQPASGRILSGGVDSTALYPPKRFLGAARNIEDGGSLTILASALVDTGSKMDEVIFEEFKGTGNMELKLDRDLADRRVFPAVDPVASGTRKEELLLDPSFAPLVWGLRRILANMNNNERAMTMLIKALRATGNNEEFLLRTAKKAQNQDFAGEL